MPSMRVEGLITWDTVTRFRAASAACTPRGDIAIEFDSHGGDVAPALALADAIRAHRGTTYGRVDRQADSGAALCFAACSVRGAGWRRIFSFTKRRPGLFMGD